MQPGRGLFRRLIPGALPEYTGVGYPENDGLSLVLDSTVRGGLRPGSAAGNSLVPTPVKTSAYAAQPGDLVIANASATFAVTLPSPAPDNAEVGIILNGQTGSNVVGLYTSGGALIDPGAINSLFLTQVGQSYTVQYDLALNVWYITQASGVAPNNGAQVPSWDMPGSLVSATSDLVVPPNTLTLSKISFGLVTLGTANSSWELIKNGVTNVGSGTLAFAGLGGVSGAHSEVVGLTAFTLSATASPPDYLQLAITAGAGAVGLTAVVS